MRKLIIWCKQYGLTAITLFLLAFIPLYPKLPLLDINQTWVYIRFEDFLILGAAFVLFLEYIRQRHITKTPLSKPIFLYWAVGGISLINALIFIFPHLPGVLFPHLALLHYARRFEYMIVFFLAYDAFRHKPNIRAFLWAFVGSFLLIVLYGFGQKFLGFPAFMTMNEEFSKGLPLRLPSTARFPSTFGGHYDLAAYLVLTIPIIGSLVFGVEKWWQKVLYGIVVILGLIMLLFTASRTSYAVYLIAMSVMILWHKKPIYIIPMLAISLFTMSLMSGVSERFEKTFRVSDVVVDLSTGKPIGTLASLEGGQATIQKSASPATESLPTGSEFINIASNQTTAAAQATEIKYATGGEIRGDTGDIATISGSFLIQKALVYDISITTRLQGEWPKAIAAFKRNILLGSGYSSLSVAVDGDYHRMLGETGLAGAAAFLGIFAAALYIFFRHKDSLKPLERSIVIGIFAGLIGLLINAVLIDVFEASKVAYVLWILLGIAIAILAHGRIVAFDYFALLKRIVTHKIAYVLYLFLAVAFVWQKTFNLYFLGDDFTWLRWAAQSRMSDVMTFFTNSAGFFYRPVPKLWYFGLFSVFWLKPFAYHLASVALLLFTVWGIYKILLQRHVRLPIAWVGAFLFAVLAGHHENVYWISGQSSLLAAAFLVGAIFLGDAVQTSWKTVYRIAGYIGTGILLFCSMASYDGMLLAPVITWFVIWTSDRKKSWTFIYLLLIPFYLWMRMHAGALNPGGDYGYKTSTFFINAVSNTAGYMVATFGGPKVIDLWNTWRVAMRPHLTELTIGGIFIGLFVLRILWSIRGFVRRYADMFIWGTAGLISLAAYAPLGGMADRYMYIPSVFFVMALIFAADSWWKRHTSVAAKACLCLIVIGIAWWNIAEVQRLGGDWQKAGDTAEQALQVIKKETFPPKDVKTFFIINMPIRYGNAWIFPTGMTDAIWLMYRENPFRVFTVDTVEEAYRFVLTQGDREVFVFDNFKLKRGIRIEQKVDPKTISTK